MSIDGIGDAGQQSSPLHRKSGSVSHILVRINFSTLIPRDAESAALSLVGT